MLQIEEYSSDFNTYYHSAGDTVAHMDLDYFVANVRTLVASIASLAEPVGSPPTAVPSAAVTVPASPTAVPSAAVTVPASPTAWPPSPPPGETPSPPPGLPTATRAPSDDASALFVPVALDS